MLSAYSVGKAGLNTASVLAARGKIFIIEVKINNFMKNC